MALELISVDTKLSAEDLAVSEALCLISGKSRSEFFRDCIQKVLKTEIDKASLIDEHLRSKGFTSGIRRG